MKLCVYVALWIVGIQPISAQPYDTLMNQAGVALGQKQYCQALAHFKRAFVDSTKIGSYDLAFGAVAAANCNQPDVAMRWLRQSVAKGLGQKPGETKQILSDAGFAALRNHPDWPEWEQTMRDADARREAEARQRQTEWTRTIRRNAVLPVKNGRYSPAPSGFAHYFNRVDTLDVPYLVRVPDAYDPTRQYPLIVYLHGGIVSTDAFRDGDPDVTVEPVFKAAPDAIILYPFGRSTFGWVKQKSAFTSVLTMINDVTKKYNVDQRRIYLGGMSNGATAAFWYATRHANRFAGFYAFAPGTELPVEAIDYDRISSAAPLYSVSAKDDSVYSYEKARALYEAYQSKAPGWTFDTLNSGGHGFIYGPDGAAVMQKMFTRMMRHTRP